MYIHVCSNFFYFLYLKSLNNQGWDVRMLGTDFSTIVVSVLQYQISFWLLLSVSWFCINGRSIIIHCFENRLQTLIVDQRG